MHCKSLRERATALIHVFQCCCSVPAREHSEEISNVDQHGHLLLAERNHSRRRCLLLPALALASARHFSTPHSCSGSYAVSSKVSLKLKDFR